MVFTLRGETQGTGVGVGVAGVGVTCGVGVGVVKEIAILKELIAPSKPSTTV